MRKFTGEVAYCLSHVVVVWRKRTCIRVYYENDDAPMFERGTTVTVESEHDFPITVSRWTDEWGKMITDRVIGQYSIWSEGIEIREVEDA